MRRFAMPAIIFAASGGSADMPLSHIERTYWDCEFAARQSLLAPNDAEVCSVAFEYLKTHKFQGDFDRFLAWWQDHHQRELSSRGPAAEPPVAE